jgi:hypothetical protein
MTKQKENPTSDAFNDNSLMVVVYNVVNITVLHHYRELASLTQS